MLVTRFEDSARFIGRLDAAQDVAAGFKTVCRENSIRCAWICATMMLRNPVVAGAGQSGFGQENIVEGTRFFPSVTGNVSLLGEDVHIRLYGQSEGTQGQPGAIGLIVGGEVLFCEFLITTCEDAALIRERVAPFSPWVQLQPSGNVVVPEFQPSPQRPTTIQPAAHTDEDEATELNILEMKAGDYVDHPRFGVCRISADPADDKISIKLATGKQVDLSLGVMKVHDPKQLGGRRVFKLEIKRR